MDKVEVAEMILEKKKTAGLTWESIAESIGMSPVFTTSACLGMNSMPREKADLLPTDPCIYRLYEIVGVYGETIKELIQEKGGDGIMSAIDFEMYVDKIPDPKGDRIEVKMSGKFLPYKAW